MILAWGGLCLPWGAAASAEPSVEPATTAADGPGAPPEPVADTPSLLVLGAGADRASGEGDRDPTAFATTLHAGRGASLGTVLLEAPGTDVRRAGAHREELQVRGAGAAQLAVFLDEIPLTGARGGAFDLSLVPTALVDRVEVLRGPTAATWGSAAQGGVLRLNTRPVGPGRARSAALRLGQFGQAGLSVAEAWGGARADVLALAGAARSDGDFPYEDVQGHTRRRQNNGASAVNGLVRGRVGLGDDARLTVLALGVDDERGEPGVEQFEAERAHARRTRWLVSVGASDDTLGGAPLEGGVVAHVSRAEDAYRDPAPTLWGAPTRADLADGSEGLRTEVAPTGLGPHRPRLAVEGRHESARSQLQAALEPDRRDARWTGAAVVSEAYAPWDGRLLASAALRLDARTGRDPLLVPQAGLAGRPFAPLTLRGNVGRIFRDPSFDELYTQGPGLRGNPELRPEDGWSWDAGAELRLARALLLQAAVFGQRFERTILFMPVQAYLVEARDDHGARIFGQEATADVRYGPGRLLLTYTHLDARFEPAPRTPLPNRPAHRLYGRLEGQVARATVFGAADARSGVTIDRFGHRRIDGRTLCDLGAVGPLGAGFEAGLTFHNVLDVRDAQDAVQQPLPGRTWLFSLRFQDGG